MQNPATVHVYANARRFVIVPAISDLNGEPVEIAKAETVPLTLGRPTVVRLSRALRTAREASLSSTPTEPRWDGEDGRWWSHHLLGLSVRWEEDRITLSELEQGSDKPSLLPADATDVELAEQLIDLLGRKLQTP